MVAKAPNGSMKKKIVLTYRYGPLYEISYRHKRTAEVIEELQGPMIMAKVTRVRPRSQEDG